VDERLEAHVVVQPAMRIGETLGHAAARPARAPGNSLCAQSERTILGVMAIIGETPDLRLLAPAELRAWRGMLRAHAAMAKALDAQLEAAHGLQLSSYEVLMYLADAEEERMRMCDLASSILLSRSGLTRLVDRLAREGLLERVACSDDARGQFAKLTPAGREKLRAARETHLGGVRAMFLDLFTTAELDALGDAWDRVLDATGWGCCK
jgi:DNA-binding MarR family transcriptional regulator